MAEWFEEEKEEEISGLFDVEVKGRINAPVSLMRQLERCNILGSTGDEEKFMRAVMMLLDDLPLAVKRRVEARRDEYMVGGPEWFYLKNCGYPMGHPDDPVCDEHGNPISPVLVNRPEEPDPYMLLSVIKEELERANLTWEYREEHKAIRKIGEPLPEGIVSRAEQMLVRFIRQVRAENPELKIGWRQLVGELLQRSPEIPLFEEEEE